MSKKAIHKEESPKRRCCNCSRSDFRATQGILNQAFIKDPGNFFVASCQRFFNDRGFLSDKQIDALLSIKTTSYPYDPGCDATYEDIF